jgi:hypothetical protein
MAPDAVGADDHQRADAVQHGALDLRVGHLTPFSAALAAILAPAALASLAGGGAGHSPVSAAVRSSAGCGGQSARAQRACGGALGVKLAVAQRAEELGPLRHRPRPGRRRGALQLVDVIGIGPVQEGRGVKAGRLGDWSVIAFPFRSRGGVPGLVKMAPGAARPAPIALIAFITTASPSRRGCRLITLTITAARAVGHHDAGGFHRLDLDFRHRPCHRRRWRRHGPCGGRGGRCGRR